MKEKIVLKYMAFFKPMCYIKEQGFSRRYPTPQYPLASRKLLQPVHEEITTISYKDAITPPTASDSIVSWRPLHHEPKDVLLEANMRHGHRNGMKEHNRLAFDLPPNQKIGTSIFVLYYHRWGDHFFFR